MKYLKTDDAIADADSGEDAQRATALLEARIVELERDIASLPPGYNPVDKAELQLQIASMLVDLERGEEAFDIAREAYDVLLEARAWEALAQACNIMFMADQPLSLAALGQGIWVAVTFPEVDPELTVALLQHVVDDTPADSDGAALAAATAHYIADLRTEGKKHEDLTFFTSQQLAAVARRHSDVQNQAAFDVWFKRLELDDPDKFLVRLRNVVDVLVQEDWWLDRDAIWESLAVN